MIGKVPARRTDVAGHIFGPSVQSAVLVAVAVFVFIAIATCVCVAVIVLEVFGHPSLFTDGDDSICLPITAVGD